MLAKIATFFAPLLLVAVAFLFTPFACASDLFESPKPYEGSWLDISLASKHVNTSTDHNERNFGLGLERWAFGRNWLIGSYKNSYYRNSSFILTELTSIRLSDTLRVRLNGGVVTGYSRPILPGVIPVWTYETRRWGIDAVVIPPIGDRMGLFAIQAKIKF